MFFTASDGTRYYPYEAVYAVGEIKSKFRRREHQLGHLVESVTHVKMVLRRERTPNNYVPGLGVVPQVSGPWPYRNPLFTFAFFGEAGDFTLEDAATAFEGVPWSCVPNMICLLDGGVVALMRTSLGEDRQEVRQLITVPEFEKPMDGAQYAWTYLPMGKDDIRQAANLATLQWGLVSHLDGIGLMALKPEILKAYLDTAGLTKYFRGQTVPAKRPPGDDPPEIVRG